MTIDSQDKLVNAQRRQILMGAMVCAAGLGAGSIGNAAAKKKQPALPPVHKGEVEGLKGLRVAITTDDMA